ncbi:MAG: polyprenol monophosphomannose synthase [Saprospiraceae bacterium]|nr:polyprenol monophosphomannose synthase [Saprospiraceae bacterium]
MSRNLVIIPTYNEIENIESILNAVIQLPLECDILVVDDGSPDGTGAKVLECADRFPGRIHLLQRQEKSGLGKAYVAGFNWALNRSYTCIAEMDADFSHPPERLIEMFGTCNSGKADVCVGSRYVKGGGVLNWPKSRLLLSKGASLYVRMITGMPVLDPTAGFICYKSNVLQAINLNNLQFSGYAFQIEMKYSAYKLGFTIREIPILFPDRIRGKSKMNIFIIKEALLGVFQLRFKKFNPVIRHS